MKPTRGFVVEQAKRRLRAAAETGFVRVTGYRLYGLDGVRKVASGDWIDADSDEAAVEAANEIFRGSECEIWQGTRLVARLDLRRKPSRSG
jgi:hypothetical protein